MQNVFCETCTKPVPRDGALMSEGRDFVAYFCSPECYDRWRDAREPRRDDVQEGAGRSIARDERLKRAIHRDPQRDEPRADSVERGDLPPR